MHRKKGFTLIELIGVIIILGILALIIYPIMTRTIKNQEKKSFRQSLEGIMSSVRNDMADDDNVVPRYYYYENGKLTLLSVNDKERNEEIKTNGKAKVNGYIYVDMEGNIILDYLCDKKYCGYNTEEDSDVVIVANGGGNSQVDLETPILELKGKETMVLPVGGRYIEPGVEAKTKLGKNLSEFVVISIQKKGQTVTMIDTSVEGDYTISYTVTYQGQTLEKQRTVVVKEERPIITITSASSKYVKKQDVQIKVSPMGESRVTNFVYRVNDGREKTVMGTSTTLSLADSGEYRVSVEVTDDQGHKASVTSDVYKIDNIAPKIIVPETPKIKITEIGGYNPLDGVEITDNVGVVETTVEGSLSASIGVQTITLIAKDEAGNETNQVRNIEVITSEGPILNLSSVRTEQWVKNLSVTAMATASIPITTFTYEVIKDGVSSGSQNGTINGMSGTVTIPLTESGRYQIKLIGVDETGSSSHLTSGEYLIDNGVPGAPILTGGSTDYTKTSRMISVGTEPTSLSGIDHYEYYSSTSSTSQTGGSWITLASGTKQVVGSTEGTRYIYMRAVNGVGTKGAISSPQTVKVDKTAPSSATIAVGAKDPSGTKINVTLTGADSGSGIAKYVVYYGTSSSSMTSTKTVTSSASSVTTQLTGLNGSTTYYLKVEVYDSVGNTKTSSVVSTKTGVQIVEFSNAGANGKYTLVVPSSQTNPTKFEIYSVEKQDIYVGIKIMKPIKVGDQIEVVYTVTRYGSYYLDIKDNQHAGTYSNLETNPTTSQNGVVRNNKFTAAFDTNYYEVRLLKTNGTLSSVYGEMEIYSLTINGERIL